MVAAPDALFRNRGDGTFSQVTSKAGMEVSPAYGLGAVWGDYDNDGDPDLYVANDSMANFLFQNRGRRDVFRDVAALGGVAYNQDGREQAGMGVAFGDYDRGRVSGSLCDQLFGRLPHALPQPERTTVPRRHLRRGGGLPQLAVPGLGGPLRRPGQRRPAGPVRFQRAHLSARWTATRRVPVSPSASSYFGIRGTASSGRRRENGVRICRRPGRAGERLFADFDNDGDLDVAVNNLDARPSLFRNEGAAGAGHWLNLALEGKPSNRSAIGTRVILQAGDWSQLQEVHGGSSYQATNDFRLHFGLGESAEGEEADRTLA